MNKIKSKWPTIRALLLKLILKGSLYFLISSIGLVFIYRFVPVFITPLMVIRSVQSTWGDHWVGINKHWVPLDKINSSMVKAVLKAEDSRFFEHNGFDYKAIQQAMKYNQTHKRKKGASTISQQTAKNVFLWPHRDWIRKGFEAYFTVLIEIFWPKDRIMEVYLNVIELGDGVYGVGAATQKFFKKRTEDLTPYQASLIAAVLPNPRKFRIDRPSAYVMSRQRRILGRVAPDIPKAEDTSALDLFDLKLESTDDDN